MRAKQAVIQLQEAMVSPECFAQEKLTTQKLK